MQRGGQQFKSKLSPEEIKIQLDHYDRLDSGVTKWKRTYTILHCDNSFYWRREVVEKYPTVDTLGQSKKYRIENPYYQNSFDAIWFHLLIPPKLISQIQRCLSDNNGDNIKDHTIIMKKLLDSDLVRDGTFDYPERWKYAFYEENALAFTINDPQTYVADVYDYKKLQNYGVTHIKKQIRQFMANQSLGNLNQPYQYFRIAPNFQHRFEYNASNRIGDNLREFYLKDAELKVLFVYAHSREVKQQNVDEYAIQIYENGQQKDYLFENFIRLYRPNRLEHLLIFAYTCYAGNVSIIAKKFYPQQNLISISAACGPNERAKFSESHVNAAIFASFCPLENQKEFYDSFVERIEQKKLIHQEIQVPERYFQLDSIWFKQFLGNFTKQIERGFQKYSGQQKKYKNILMMNGYGTSESIPQERLVKRDSLKDCYFYQGYRKDNKHKGYGQVYVYQLKKRFFAEFDQTPNGDCLICHESKGLQIWDIGHTKHNSKTEKNYWHITNHYNFWFKFKHSSDWRTKQCNGVVLSLQYYREKNQRQYYSTFQFKDNKLDCKLVHAQFFKQKPVSSQKYINQQRKYLLEMQKKARSIQDDKIYSQRLTISISNQALKINRLFWRNGKQQEQKTDFSGLLEHYHSIDLFGKYKDNFKSEFFVSFYIKNDKCYCHVAKIDENLEKLLKEGKVLEKKMMNND